ncbi:MAG TPA: hypothetical protein VFO19_22375, partial [Vicinamibacterales bacterium]|nr:hypothetical protein [Vicinamibacterales bacterium]
MRKILLIAAAVVLVLAVGLFLWARSVLAGDAVRDAVAAQLTSALGQPVTIASAGTSIFPRVTLTLHEVRIGTPAHTTVGRLHVGTAFGALVSRRIEQADVRLDNARIELPLRIFGAGPSSAPAAGAPVEIVSVDTIGLRDVQIVSGGRTLAGDADLQWQNGRLIVRDVSLAAGEARIAAKGELTDLAGPKGKLELDANNLSLVELAAFFSDFSSGVSTP